VSVVVRSSSCPFCGAELLFDDARHRILHQAPACKKYLVLVDKTGGHDDGRVFVINVEGSV
jgi:hypothetical protein